MEWKLPLRQEVGTHIGARATYGEKFRNGFETLISATGYKSKGQNLYFTNPEFARPKTTTDGPTLRRRKGPSLFARATFKNLSLESAFVSREKWIPTASWDTVFNSGKDKTVDKRGYLDLAYNTTFGSTLDVIVRLYYDFYQFDGYYLFDDPPLPK